MSLKHREDSIQGIRRREAQRTKIATSAEYVDGSIYLELPEGHVCDGTMVKFCAPCSCVEVTGGIVIDGTTYTVVGPMLNCVTGIGGVWDAGAQLSVVIDQTAQRAFLQNTSNYRLLISETKPRNGPLLWFKIEPEQPEEVILDLADEGDSDVKAEIDGQMYDVNNAGINIEPTEDMYNIAVIE